MTANNRALHRRSTLLYTRIACRLRRRRRWFVLALALLPYRRGLLEEVVGLAPASNIPTNIITYDKTRHLLRNAPTGVLSANDKSRIFVWRSSERSATQPKNDDELMGSCDTLGNISCSRALHGDDFGVTYSFFTKKAIQVDFGSLDKQVLNEIERMRCRR